VPGFLFEGGAGSYDGCFDAATRTFYMEYTNAVDDGYGQLSADGTTLSGSWYSYEDDGAHHAWTLARAR